MKLYFALLLLFSATNIFAQETVSPAPPQSQPIAITGATIHVGNGEVLTNATVVMNNGHITAVGSNAVIPAGA